MNIPFRPLGKVRELVESIGLDISYAYDDIVFSDHSLFILQFNDVKPNVLSLYFNEDCEEKELISLKTKLINSAHKQEFVIENKGTFSISQNEDEENLQLIFHD